MGSVLRRQHNHHIMGLLNLSSVSFSLILGSVIVQHSSSTPIFADPLSAIALSGVGGLVFTGASGATLSSIPAVTLLAGKALLIKKLLLKKALLGGYLYKQSLRDQQGMRGSYSRRYQRRRGNYWRG